MGFSDVQLGGLSKQRTTRRPRDCARKLGMLPVYKLVDTCAAEFEAYTPYYYSTYEDENESAPTAGKKS